MKKSVKNNSFTRILFLAFVLSFFIGTITYNNSSELTSHNQIEEPDHECPNPKFIVIDEEIIMVCGGGHE